MTCKEGQFEIVKLMNFSINLNAQYVNGMTYFYWSYLVEISKNICTVIRYSRVNYLSIPIHPVFDLHY